MTRASVLSHGDDLGRAPWGILQKEAFGVPTIWSPEVYGLCAVTLRRGSPAFYTDEAPNPGKEGGYRRNDAYSTSRDKNALRSGTSRCQLQL